VPYLDVEKESVRINATTVRTIQRTYGRDADGRRTVTQVVEEVKNTLPGQAEKVVRNTSTPDADGRLHLVHREEEDTKQASANVTEIKTTAYTSGPEGQLVPSVRTQEQRTRSGDHEVQFHKSTMLSDVNGTWQTQEVRDGVIKDDTQQQTKDERVSRPNTDGQMAVVERTVTRQPKEASGEGNETVESYATNTPGSADEGELRLNEKVTTVRRKTLQGGTVTEKHVMQRNAGTPGDGLRPTQKTIDVVRPTSSGGSEHRQQTISIDSNGSSNVVWVDMGKSSEAIKADTNQPASSPSVTVGDRAPAKPQ
jgi:hypothetical protein